MDERKISFVIIIIIIIIITIIVIIIIIIHGLPMLLFKVKLICYIFLKIYC